MNTWTEADIVYLRRYWLRSGVSRIAAALGKPVSTVSGYARRLGLPMRPRTDLTPALARRVRQLVRAGACNRCIGRELKASRCTVRHWRRKLGLPAVTSRGMLASCRRCTQGVRERTQAQCERAGVASLAEVRALALRGYAARYGWPADLPPRCVQILNALARLGPMTRRELAQAIGLRWLGSRKTFKCRRGLPGGSYTAHLLWRGLILSLGRICKGRGKGCSTQVYSLSLTAQRSFSNAEQVRA